MPYLGVTPAAEFTSKDLNGSELILDADADTTITADTDDQIDIRIGGSDVVQLTANGLTTTGTVEPSGDTAAGDNAAIGYTSAEGLILTGQGSTNDVTIKRDDDTAVLEVATGQSDIEITGGNIFFGTASKGVYLGVTSATAANLLADYEEGSWTPNLSWDSGGTTGVAYHTQVGTYVKVGKLVHAAFFLRTTNNGTGSGAATITGLPFTVKNTAAAYGSSLVTNYRAGFSADHYPGGYAIKNDTGIYLQNLDPDSTGSSGMSESDWTDTGQIYAHITYISES